MDMQIDQSGVVGVRPARSSPRLNGACRALLGENLREWVNVEMNESVCA